MNEAKRSRRAVSPAWCENAYGLALARGSSHIASTLTPCSRARAIAGVVEDFANQHGKDDLAAFLDLLATRLDQRGASAGAEAVGALARQAAQRPCQARRGPGLCGNPPARVDPAGQAHLTVQDAGLSDRNTPAASSC